MKNTHNFGFTSTTTGGWGYVYGLDLIWEEKHQLYQITLWCQRYCTLNSGIPIFYRKYHKYTTRFDHLKVKWILTNRNRSMFTYMKKDVGGTRKPGVAPVNGNMLGSP